MEERHEPLEAAKSMMDSALFILDRLGETNAAAHLQQAICILRGDVLLTSIEEVDRFLESPEARALTDRLDRSPEAAQAPAAFSPM